MIALLQRVTQARVSVDGLTVGEIGPGLLALIGVHDTDQFANAQRLAERILAYRVFPDSVGRMNLSLADTAGSLLLVPQFTLAADTRSGNRPSFSNAAPPNAARSLFDALVSAASSLHPHIATGQFGAHMRVGLENDGPVTFWLDA